MQKVETTLGKTVTEKAADKPETVTEGAKRQCQNLPAMLIKTEAFFTSRVNTLRVLMYLQNVYALAELRNMAGNLYEGASAIEVSNAKADWLN